MGPLSPFEKALHFLISKQKFYLFFLGLVLILTAQAFSDEYSIQDIALTPGKNIHEVNINWYSEANTNSLVQIAPKAAMQNQELLQEFPAESSVSHYTMRLSAASGYYSHKAVLTSLSASTEYVYRIGDGSDNWTPVYELKTGSPNQFSFFVVGDPQIGAGGTASDTDAWTLTLNKAFNAFPSTGFILSVGDQVQIAGDESHFSGFFAPQQLKNIPLAPALGNHDTGAYNTGYHFNLPNLSTEYGVTDPGIGDYYFTYGNTLFIVLNSNNMSAASHEVFISNAIALNPYVTWKIVIFHHDIYGSGFHAIEYSMQNFRAAIFPIMDIYEIDVVFTGHDHSYTRTHVMKGDISQLNQSYDPNGALINPTGTVYFTLNSASGSKYYSLNATTANYVAVRSQLEVPTFSRVSVNNNQLTFNTYRTDTMAITDTFSIVKDNHEPRRYFIETHISSDMDDIEERVSDGVVFTDSPDLEMVYDSDVGGDQILGLRFNNIDLPFNAVINQAYIQFTCSEATRGAGNLTIYGEYSANASPFTTSDYSVSSRGRTIGSVNWSPAAWDTEGESSLKQQTPNLASVISEILQHPNWTTDNSLALIISGTVCSHRCCSHRCCSHRCCSHRCCSYRCCSHRCCSHRCCSHRCCSHRCCSHRCCSYRCAESYAGSNSQAPKLVIQSTPVDEKIVNSRINSTNNDAEENLADGSMYNNSDNLELIYDADGINQLAGMKFDAINIPKGSRILEVYIQFTTCEVSTGTASLTIKGEYNGNASEFTTNAYDISNRVTTSNSVDWNPPEWTSEGQAGPGQRTSDISAIVQEIIDHPDWVSGNSIALIVSGTAGSRRCAESFDGSSNSAPQLVIYFSDVPWSLGDVNHDDKINIIDALSIARYYVGLNLPNFDIAVADTNCDKSVTILDTLLIARFYVGLIRGF